MAVLIVPLLKQKLMPQSFCVLALQDTNGQEIYDLFYKFEEKETYESKVAHALDKLEVQLQHNHADFSTW